MACGLLPQWGPRAERTRNSQVFVAINSHASLPATRYLPRRRHRSQQPFTKGVLSAACRSFGAVRSCSDPVRAMAQLGAGRIHRMSHWTTPP
jgi:hypothetical protein